MNKKYSQMHQTAKCFASDLNDTSLDKMDKMIVAYISIDSKQQIIRYRRQQGGQNVFFIIFFLQFINTVHKLFGSLTKQNTHIKFVTDCQQKCDRLLKFVKNNFYPDTFPQTVSNKPNNKQHKYIAHYTYQSDLQCLQRQLTEFGCILPGTTCSWYIQKDQRGL